MKILLFLLSVLITPCLAQSIQGVVHYETIVDVESKLQVLADPSTSLDKKKEIQNYIDFMKSAFEASYLLTFNSSESLYQVRENLSLGNEVASTKDVQDDVYKNFGEGIYIVKRDLVGKTYMVSEMFPNYKWVMHPDIKQIGKYTCSKATFSIEHQVEENVQNTDGSFEVKMVNKLITKTAWYCPELPIMNGPALYGGLPGLILEISDDASPLIIRCTKIDINPAKPVKIKRPKAKRYYTELEYKEILKSL